MKKVGIIGHVNHGLTTLPKEIHDKLEKEFYEREVNDIISYVIKPTHQYFEGKQFVCKGKHQYTETKIDESDGTISIKWICQCGRNMKD